MVIDLHVHTLPLSQCSEMEAEEAIEEAKRVGLDGICFTEHNRIWDAKAIATLRKKHDFLILRGIEIDTIEGHVVAFGICQDFSGVVPIKELRDSFSSRESILIAAHPLRGFLVFGTTHLGITAEQGSQKPIFKSVDAVEAYSGRMTEQEIELSLEVSEKLNLAIVGGSDAHRRREIGRCVTTFENDIHNEAELIHELRTGQFKAGYFRR
ncbi:MAG: PHP domain-containing protein [Chloroflexi bacterium]|nr:PHP domain-containing protein [Chloroflexota bacterium]